MSRITFALAKGRLAKKTLEILDRIDIRPVDMTDESRKLVFIIKGLGLYYADLFSLFINQ